MDSPKFNINLRILIVVNIFILIILISLIVILILKANNLYSVKNILTSVPSQFSQTSSLSVDKSTIFEDQQILKNKNSNFKKLIGYIKNIYEKDGEIYINFDETSACISELSEVAKAMIEDGKCLPNVTFEEVLAKLKNSSFDNLTELCPNQSFGYGVGYCYFRNTSTETINFKVHPEIIILYNIHSYDFQTKELYKGIQNYQISLNTFRKDYYPKDKFKVFEIKVLDNVVFAITEHFVSKE